MHTYVRTGAPVPLYATIADATSLSGVVDLSGATLVGVLTPSGWSAAAITFQASVDGTNFHNYENSSGTEVSLTSCTGAEWRAVNPNDFVGVRYLKVRSGTAGAPVNQAGGDTVTLIVRNV